MVSACVKVSICTTCIMITWLTLFNVLFTIYAYIPVANPEKYESDNCYICKCNITGFYQNSTNYFTYITITYGLEGFNTTTELTINYNEYNYCNKTSITCYHYIDDISSLTLTENDLKPTRSTGDMILIYVISNVFISFAICAISIIFGMLLFKE